MVLWKRRLVKRGDVKGHGKNKGRGRGAGDLKRDGKCDKVKPEKTTLKNRERGQEPWLEKPGGDCPLNGCF